MGMKSMIDVRKCGSLKSMRHVTSRPYEDKSVPHLTLYVQQMTKTKLLKEREVMRNRLGEIDKELKHIDNYMSELRPKLGLPDAKRSVRPCKCKEEVFEGKHGRKKKFSKMKMAF